ncbi:MAG TPA: 5'/3'-nucleotidase SurE [Thermoanaerobaculia bacterium]|nr:5'/3'-nucleotidase SurE [Thermoanaerobaculia bacterium]
MTRILVTNDDGIFSQGIKALAEELSAIAEVIVVAPDREQSASSHALTLDRPLRMRRIEENWYAVDGTPTDCVALAVQSLLKDNPPDLVASGINFGLNLGDDVTYSGTVSATFEGVLLGVPSIAFSQEVAEGFSFPRAARCARGLVEAFLALPREPNRLWSVNFPASPFQGVRWTRLGKREYQQAVVEKTDPRGRQYFWIAGTPMWEKAEGTDHQAVAESCVSLTPLHLDLTDYPSLRELTQIEERLSELARSVEEG